MIKYLATKLIQTKEGVLYVYAPTKIIAQITSREKKRPYPTHIKVSNLSGLEDQSIVMLEQIRTISKNRLIYYLGALDKHTMERVNCALKISISLNEKQE